MKAPNDVPRTYARGKGDCHVLQTTRYDLGTAYLPGLREEDRVAELPTGDLPVLQRDAAAGRRACGACHAGAEDACHAGRARGAETFGAAFRSPSVAARRMRRSGVPGQRALP